MERSAEALSLRSGGDKQMMQAASGSSRVAGLLSDAADEITAMKAKLAGLRALAAEVQKEQRYQKDTEMHDNYTDRARSREREWKALQQLVAIAAAEQGGAS